MHSEGRRIPVMSVVRWASPPSLAVAFGWRIGVRGCVPPASCGRERTKGMASLHWLPACS